MHSYSSVPLDSQVVQNIRTQNQLDFFHLNKSSEDKSSQYHSLTQSVHQIQPHHELSPPSNIPDNGPNIDQQPDKDNSSNGSQVVTTGLLKGSAHTEGEGQLDDNLFQRLRDRETKERQRKRKWNVKDSALRQKLYSELGIKHRSEKTRINREFADFFLKHPQQKIDVDHKKFGEYDYDTVIRPAVKRASYFMSRLHGSQWTVPRCEELLRIIFRNRVCRTNFKPKADLKCAIARDQANLEMRQAQRVMHGPEPKGDFILSESGLMEGEIHIYINIINHLNQ